MASHLKNMKSKMTSMHACTKAFDKVRHEDKLQVLRELLFDEKDIRLVMN